METLFLSQLKLNPRNRPALRDLGDCQQLHQTILNGFPQTEGETARREFGLLFRVESDQRGWVKLLVQSRFEPDWTRLPEGYLIERAMAKPLASIYNGLKSGQRLTFRLRANPTKRLPILIENRIGKERGKRIELRREEDQLAWLARKAGDHGFRLLGARVKPEPKAMGARAGKRITFASAVFEGELEITDAARFRQTLAEGIGSGKAYGFGLLSVAPVRA